MESVKLNVENREELLDALNNAVVALDEIRAKIFFGGIELSNKWNTWLEKNDNDIDKCVDILKKRIKILQDVYNQLEK